MADWKEGARIKASREGWKTLREQKVGPCRVCGFTTASGVIELHHLVSRGQYGDDVVDNLAPLCTEHHRLVEARDPATCTTLRKNMTPDEVDYCARKKGWDWLNRRYPLELVVSTSDPNVTFSVSDTVTNTVTGEVYQVTSTPANTTHPGEDCPTCHRRIPHPKKTSTPKSGVISYRVPDENRDTHKETLEAAAKHINVYGSPFWMEKLMTVGAVLILQGPADLLD